MLTVCNFDVNKDRGKVIPGLAPDIQKLIDTHKITDTSAEVTYNGITELKDCGCRVNDEFEAIMLQRQFSRIANSNTGMGSSQGPAPVQSE